MEFNSAVSNGVVTVTLREAQSNGKPATTVRATLSGTAGTGVHTFTCADGGGNDCSLDANTKYFIHLAHVSGWPRALVSTNSDNETLLPADNGWSIEDALRRQPNYDLVSAGHALQIQVQAQPHEELIASGITATGATLTLNRHIGAWWYKSTTAGQTTCTSAGGSASVSLTLTAGTSYTFSAYGDSACTTANLLATAAQFTTLATLTASGVTATGATLTIASHGGVEWYYKHTNTGATCDGPVAAGTSTKALTNLTAGTSYTFSAYTDSACTTGNLLAAASQFTTPASLTVSNVGTTTARITIGGHTNQWWYQADNGPHTTCQGPVAAATSYKDLTGLTAGGFYAYSAYSASGCADANLLATAEVATAVTVSNLGAANSGTSHWIDRYGQGFTTGNADATLLSATVAFSNAFGNYNGITVSLRAAQSNGKPATTDLASLSGRAERNKQSRFTCADGGGNDCSLEANTKYFIYVSGNGSWLVSTASNTETLQPASNGWSIEDALRRQPNFDLASSGYALKIKVEAQPHEELTASSITATGATLTLNRHTGAWYYKSTTTGQTTCTSAGSATSVTLTLTSGTSYTFSAYSDSTCTTGNLLATAAEFTTP